jgi:bifunctional DNA-binding transcriptional regulator/antitoxin component of YhaV-PrlF toxin-antitoxin module
MASLSGPHPISAQYQVKIPTKLARELHLQTGDQFFWRRSDDDPAVLILIPAEVVERRYFAGEQAESAMHPRAAEVDSALSGDTAVHGPADG